MMKRKAIFTILHGEKYLQTWRQYCEPSWRAYAARHAYDIVLITEPIRRLHDLSVRPIHWQKLFIPRHPEAARYEDIVFLDADIIVNYHHAPCIVAANASNKLGVVAFDRYFDDDLHYHNVFMRKAMFSNITERTQALRAGIAPGKYTLSGPDCYHTYSEFTTRLDVPRINTGVLVMKPALHADFLEQVYHDSFADMQNGALPGHYEQSYLAWKLFQSGLYQLLDERFNRIAFIEWALHYPFTFTADNPYLLRACFTTMLSNAYFLHFAASMDMLPYAQINEERDFAIIGGKNVFAGDKLRVLHRKHPLPSD